MGRIAQSKARDYPVFFEDVEALSDSLLDRQDYNPGQKQSKEKLSPCDECGLRAGCITPQIGMSAYKGADILLVGEAPGKLEDEKGKPFIGESGKLLRKTLQEYELLHRCAFTNICRCRPHANATPTPKQAKLCADQFIWEDIKKIQPKLVVLLGGTAIKYFLGAMQVDAARNAVHELNGYKFIASVHPAYILRNPSAVAAYNKDFKKIVNLLNNVQPKQVEVRELKDSTAYLTYLHSVPEFGFDIETNSLTPYGSGNIILGCSFYDGVEPPTFIEWKNIDVELFKSLASSRAQKIMHNGKFDMLHTLVLAGSRWKNFGFDTMVGAYLLDETRTGVGLEQLAWEYLPDCVGWKKEAKQYMEDMTQCPHDLLVRYAALDAYYTYEIKKAMEGEVKAQGMEWLMKFICHCLVSLTHVEAKGTKIDTEFLKTAYEKVKNESLAVSTKFLQFAKDNNMTEFNINSPIHLKKLMFDVLKVPVLNKTKTGKPALDKDTLPMYEKKVPEVKLLINYRRYEKIKSTYLEGLNQNVDENGIVHTTFHMTRTKTGRTASSHPMNFQNIPRKREDEILSGFNPYPLVKRCFTSRWQTEGCIVESDFSQLELRVLAMMSKDGNLLEIFNQGGDIHGEVAKQISKKSKPSDEDRNRAKAINFGIAYGAGPSTISDTMGCSYDEAKTYIDRWYKKFPGVRAWIDTIRWHLKKHGYVVSPIGRRRRIPEIYDRDEYIREKAFREAINAPIQGVASDILLYCLNKIIDYCEDNHTKSYPIIPIHDSILFDIHNDELADMKELIVQVMEHVDLPFINVPLRVSMKMGKSWASVNSF